MVDFVFAAQPSTTTPITPRDSGTLNTAWPHATASEGALAPLTPTAFPGPPFIVGGGDTETRQRRSSGPRSSGGNRGRFRSAAAFRRHGPAAAVGSPADALPLYAAAVAASSTPTTQPRTGRSQDLAAHSPTWASAAPSLTGSSVEVHEQAAAGDSATGGSPWSGPGGHVGGAASSALFDEAGGNALDQLISLLLLPDDDPSGLGDMLCGGGGGGGGGPVAATAPAVVANGDPSGDTDPRDTVRPLPVGGPAVRTLNGTPGGFLPAEVQRRPAAGQPPLGLVAAAPGLAAPGGPVGPPGSSTTAPMRRTGLAPARLPQATTRAGPVASASVGGDSDDGTAALGLDALAAALDEVETSLDWPSSPPSALLGLGSLSLEDADTAAAAVPGSGRSAQDSQQRQQQQEQERRRRPKRVAKRAASELADRPAEAVRRDDRAARGSGVGDGGSWRVMLSAPAPHNPESVATLLLAGRLVNPTTAVPAPLLAAAATRHPTPHPPQPQANGADGAGSCALGAQVPAVAVVRCPTEQDAALALALNGRRLYSPTRALARSGADVWRPMTVVLQCWPEGRGGAGGAPPVLAVPPRPASAASSSSPLQGSRVREAGSRVRRVVVSGLPGHLDVDDVIALFGNGLQLPGHCPTPQHRRFLMLCPDAAAFNAMLEWSGTQLPDKPLDALQQIVPRVAGWCTVRVEEDDGVQLPALMSHLLSTARHGGGGGSAAAADSAVAAAAARRQQLYPPVAGRFHPADLDEMDEMMAAATAATAADATADSAESAAPPSSAATITAGPVTAAAGTDGGEPAAKAAGANPAVEGTATQGALAVIGGASAAVTNRSPEERLHALSLYSPEDAAAAAERAESSRGASSSGLAARPAPRLRRAGGGGQYAASSGAGGVFFGPGSSAAGAAAAGVHAASALHGNAAAAAAARCACCPLPSSAGASGDMGWSGQAAVELLSKLLALGIEPLGEGAAEEEERAPFFRGSRKRMSMHFGRRAEEEEAEEAEEEQAGAGAAGAGTAERPGGAAGKGA